METQAEWGLPATCHSCQAAPANPHLNQQHQSKWQCRHWSISISKALINDILYCNLGGHILNISTILFKLNDAAPSPALPRHSGSGFNSLRVCRVCRVTCSSGQWVECCARQATGEWRQGYGESEIGQCEWDPETGQRWHSNTHHCGDCLVWVCWVWGHEGETGVTCVDSPTLVHPNYDMTQWPIQGRSYPGHLLMGSTKHQSKRQSWVTSVDQASGITLAQWGSEIQSRLRQCFYYSH